MASVAAHQNRDLVTQRLYPWASSTLWPSSVDTVAWRQTRTEKRYSASRLKYWVSGQAKTDKASADHENDEEAVEQRQKCAQARAHTLANCLIRHVE